MLKYIITSLVILLVFLVLSYYNDPSVTLRKSDILVALIPILVGFARLYKNRVSKN